MARVRRCLAHSSETTYGALGTARYDPQAKTKSVSRERLPQAEARRNLHFLPTLLHLLNGGPPPVPILQQSPDSLLLRQKIGGLGPLGL